MLIMDQFSSTGKPCKIISNMGIEEYHTHKDIWSSSGLRDMYRNSHNLDFPKDKTPIMQKGTDFDSFLLENDKFNKTYLAYDPSDRSKGQTIASYEAELAEFGKKLIKKETVKEFEIMRDNMCKWRHDGYYPIKSYIDNNEAQESYFMADFHGVKIRIRPDILLKKIAWLGDLKCTTNASGTAFKRKAIEMLYNMQAALYQDVYEEITGQKIKKNFWLVVEYNKPYSFNPIKIPDMAIECGRAIYITAIDKAKRLLDHNGYVDGMEKGTVFNEIEWTEWDTKKCFGG